MARKSQAVETPPEEVPGGETPAEETASGGRSFVVRHLGISGPSTPYTEGMVITEDELLQIEGVDIDRLLSLGAIEEGDGSEAPLAMVHPENQAFITSTGHVVDQAGVDRPNVTALVRSGELKVTTAADRLKMVGKGRRGEGVDPAGRSPEAIAEQQKVHRHLRDNSTVPAEVAETLTAEGNNTHKAREAAIAENEGVYEDPDPDELAPVDPANAPDMLPSPHGGRSARR